MIEAGILDGDYVVVKQQNYANNGDIVVALIEDEATVKRFYKEKDHIRLQPKIPDGADTGPASNHTGQSNGCISQALKMGHTYASGKPRQHEVSPCFTPLPIPC